MITKEQYAQLVPYEHHLMTAQKDYVHGVYSKDVDIMKPIYESLGYRLTSRSCGNCIIQMCKVLGMEFNKYKSRYYGKNKRKE